MIFDYITAAIQGFHSNNCTTMDRTGEKITASTVDRTGSNSEVTSQENTAGSFVTEITVLHKVSECLDTATQFAYEINLTLLTWPVL